MGGLSGKALLFWCGTERMVAQRDRRILTKGSGDKIVPRSQTVAAP